MKKTIITLLKVTIPIVILAYLISDVHTKDPGKFSQLLDRDKNWLLLTVSAALCLAAVSVTFLRWYMLVRSLGMPFRLRDAFRLGFLGYFLNFVAPGSVGGDVFKAFFIARGMKGRRAEAVATVVVDRMFGLYGLLVVTSAALWLGRLPGTGPEFQAVMRATYICTAIGGIVIMLLMIPGFTSGRISQSLANLPKIGPTIGQLLAAVRLYRQRPAVLVVAGLMSLGVHTIFACALYLAAGSLLTFDVAPSLGEHFVIVPLAMVAGVLPTPGGLGVFEAAMEALYRIIPAAGGNGGDGFIVALAYRLMTFAIAGIGVCYYLASRREVVETLHEAEQSGGDTDPASAPLAALAE